MSDAKTLEAYLAPPTRHKERKLNDNATSYTRLLRHTFQIDCDTQTAVNDEVTGEHLNWHSKNALKQYVPQLLDEDTFDAKHLADDHPVRYANTAATFDYDDQRDHVYCWRVPLPGRGTDFWIPLQINPGQAAEWRALLDDEDDSYTAGELRLQRDGDRWVLHVTANYEVDEQTDTTDLDDVTPVGFDVGEAQLLVGCALQDDRPRTRCSSTAAGFATSDTARNAAKTG